METSEEAPQQLGESIPGTVNGILSDRSPEETEIDNDNSENELSIDEMEVDVNGSAISESKSLQNESLPNHQVESTVVSNLESADISKEDSDDSSPLEISDNGTDISALSIYPDNVEQSEATKDTLPLPQCRTKRSYVCGYCNMKTQNPREYLYHLRDSHGETMKIFECDRCLYASKTVQKINRHNHMVHKLAKKCIAPQPKKIPKSKEEKENQQTIKKSPIANVAPMNRSPRESKSPRRYEEYEFTEALDLGQESKPIAVKTASKLHACAQCPFTTKLAKILAKHEAKCHLKKKIFKCSQCSYATHLKSRYTKHMKYHKLPVVKCDFCDFSTPYRWNLDRHMKNHNREGGFLKCHLCNFKAQIKQSLTVHIANHHVSHLKIAEAPNFDITDDITEEEMELLRMERDEDPDALEITATSPSFTVSNFDVDNDQSKESPDHSNEEYFDEPIELNSKKPKIKMTFKKMKIQKEALSHGINERHNFQKDFVHPDDVVHRHGNLYLKTEKCNYCSFKAPFQVEVIRHMKKIHGSLFRSQLKRNKKIKNTNTKVKKIKREHSDKSEDVKSFSAQNDSFVLDEEQNAEQTEVAAVDSKDIKKKPSFFEKLQEKLTMNNVENLVCQFCGHESKCLSESVRHQKLHLSAKNIYASASLSTRCQFCRQRCKTTDDLVNHLKSCSEARKNQLMENEKEQKIIAQKKKESMDSKDDDKHPMENRVFVWNDVSNSNEPDKAFKTKADNDNRSILGESTPSEASFSQDGSECTDADQDSASRKRKNNKVYKCPNCTFWSGTASRFHVHIVGHLNKKPYSCSDCGYCSNWRWDVTKHIKVKLGKKDNHKGADVLISDIIEDRNFDKYAKYLCVMERKGKPEGRLSDVKKKRSKRILEDDDTDSSKSSPCPTPINNSSTSKLPAPPKLTRAPTRKSVSTAQRKRTSEPIITGSRMVSEMEKSSNENDAEMASKKFSMKPPPLVDMGPHAQPSDQNGSNPVDSKNDSDECPTNYQIITEQGSLNTSLETLQLLASGNTNLSFLKNLQSLSGEGESSDAEVLSNQMRMLLWLNCLSREAEKKDGGESNSEPGNSDIMQLILDHEGNPEWKCSSCDFRDSEQDTVVQHVSLAHSKKGPVSLLHAVHRCNVCGFAAGTKRHVLLHIESSHGGQGSIISRSEGQSLEQDKNEEHSRTFSCRICPFSAKKQAELKKHMSHHSEKPDCVFKCVLCPYYVATKLELFEHFSVHNTVVQPKENNAADVNTEIKSKTQQEDNSPREFVCELCPFETRSRAKLVHHRQFHRPRGLPFSCPKCSYNVTRQHLLTQHLRIHGIISAEDGEGAPQTNGNCKTKLPTHTSGSKSPSPSLTITPISSQNVYKKSPIDPACLPVLSDELTKNLHDIPLVWVSRNGRFFKMFKCRHCTHVNLRKTNIQEHEKMHRSDTLPPGVGHQCQFCSYICINVGVMTSHLKVHSGTLGKCHAIVDHALPNEDQLYMLAGSSANYSNKEVKKSDEKRLYYCKHCPARFFFEKEVVIHSRFHLTTSNFANHCEKCDFKVREPQQLISHAKVHTPEYKERTRTLMAMHPSAPSHPPVAGNSVTLEAFKTAAVEASFNDTSHQITGNKPNGVVPNLPESDSIPQPPPTSRFKCDKCPSTFSKIVTLQYHQSLHSASNPFKCSQCTYAAKTQSHLDQHTLLHDKEAEEKVTDMKNIPVEVLPKSNSIQETLGLLRKKSSLSESFDQPPIKLKLLKGETSGGNAKKQFKYYIEEQVPLSGVELLKRKNQIEREMPKDSFKVPNVYIKSFKSKTPVKPEERIGNPFFFYPLHIDRNSGKTKEKRYKCLVCPSAFEKLDQFNVHLNLHGSNYKYKCKICDYSVKFYANFMMHIKRHKYHEKMDAQAKGIQDPSDDDPKFQPFIGEKQLPKVQVPKEEKNCNKENQITFDHCPDMTTTEKQHIILLQKKGDILKTKEEVDKKVYYCQHCPYASIRRDGVDSHSLRHEENNGKGVYLCHFCDYTAAQPNFIREHTKVHFRPFKFVHPAGYMRHDKLEIFSICSGDMSETVGSNKRLIISHEDNIYQPPIKRAKIEDVGPTDTSTSLIDDCFVDNGICVDFRLGDVVDAPAHMK